MTALAWLAIATAAPAAAPPPSIQDCADCPEMIVIPAGPFAMGTSEDDIRRWGVAPTNRTVGWQMPQHRVTIAHRFALGATPVTRAQYGRFAREVGDKVAGVGWESTGLRQTDDDPVVRVSWDEASAYAAWLSRRTGKRYRLPSEAEWEYAARASTTTAYWWGDDAGVGRTVCDDCGSEWDGKGTAPVRTFPANPFGLYDMLGQTFEWTRDCWNEDYRGAPADGSPWMTGDCAVHPSRGGSWNLDARIARSSQRARDDHDYQGNMVGFRIARDMEPGE
ncbi:formylglycine-generating enzyme family protein [Novosphingobium sp. BL-52-GroH]|uniref:formylglycine-generating enzyme family protein n=1 Tax=Novosphingobium sp. BL-52-GroH TaxID=3349877 RepID=UPI00384E46A2